jgi:hypothetical protein
MRRGIPKGREMDGQNCWGGVGLALRARPLRQRAGTPRMSPRSVAPPASPARPLTKEGSPTVCQTLTQVRESLASSGSRRLASSRRPTGGGRGRSVSRPARPAGGSWIALNDSVAWVALINWSAAPRQGRGKALCRRQGVNPPGPASAILPMNPPAHRATPSHENSRSQYTAICSCFRCNLRFTGTMRDQFFGEVSLWDGARWLARLSSPLWPVSCASTAQADMTNGQGERAHLTFLQVNLSLWQPGGLRRE